MTIKSLIAIYHITYIYILIIINHSLNNLFILAKWNIYI